MNPNTQHDTAVKELLDAFLARLRILSARADGVARLRREVWVKGRGESFEIDDEQAARVLRLMDEIDASLRVIRRQLSG